MKNVIEDTLSKLEDFLVDENFVYEISNENVLNNDLFLLSSAEVTEELEDTKLTELETVYINYKTSLQKIHNKFILEIGELVLKDYKVDADVMDGLKDDIEYVLETIYNLYDLINNRYLMTKHIINEKKTGWIHTSSKEKIEECCYNVFNDYEDSNFEKILAYNGLIMDAINNNKVSKYNVNLKKVIADTPYIIGKLNNEWYSDVYKYFTKCEEEYVQALVEHITNINLYITSKDTCYNTLIDWHFKNKKDI